MKLALWLPLTNRNFPKLVKRESQVAAVIFLYHWKPRAQMTLPLNIECLKEETKEHFSQEAYHKLGGEEIHFLKYFQRYFPASLLFTVSDQKQYLPLMLMRGICERQSLTSEFLWLKNNLIPERITWSLTAQGISSLYPAEREEQGQCSKCAGNGFSLCQRRFRLGIRGNFFPDRVAKPWHRWPRAAVESPSLEELRSCDVALGDMI